MILALLLSIAPGLGQDRSVLERWRESLDLDLPGEVITAALPLVARSGPLAKDGEAIALAARALAAAGEEQRAAKLLDEARPEAASLGFVEVARARLAIERDDLARAREILLVPQVAPPVTPQVASVRTDPPVRFPAIPECWLLAGRALYRSDEGTGEKERAAPLLERFLELAPLDAQAPSALHMLAQTAIALGDTAAAGELRKKALASATWQDFYRTRRLQVREKPDEPLPRLGLAELFLAAGAHARAREVCRELVARVPRFCRGFVALGLAERGLGDLAAARKAFERALDCDPRAAPTYLDLARVLAAGGDKNAAAATYARYRDLGGTEPLEEH
jgi:tetratricopeptide (TPR) repeat protein